MSNRTCKDCRHWFTSASFDAGKGLCELAESSHTKRSWYARQVHKQSLAVAWSDDSSECGARLETSENFGCTQWEARTREEESPPT